MKRPEKNVRLFNKTDDEVLQQSDVLLDSFRTNKEPFVNRFPQLADPFEATWAESTALARALPPDYDALGEQAMQTAALENLMEQGRTLFQTIMIYARLAYPGDLAILRLFGQPQYDSARNKQLKLPTLLRTLRTQITKPEYQGALMEKGLKPEEINALETVAQNIVSQDIAQQKAINDRSMAASQRITTMNAVWEKMSVVCQCAKLVFQNDAAKYNLFLLTASETPAKEGTPAPAVP